jgi:hypothetical protein
MVTNNEEVVQAPLPDSGDGQEAVSENPILDEIDRLNSAPEFTFTPEEEGEPVAETSTEEAGTETPAETPAETPVAEASTETPSEQPPPTPEPVQETPKQELSPAEVAALRKQAAEYEELRQKAVIQQETQQYQQQLENQGYTTEQAQQSTQQYMQSRKAQQDLMKKADDYGQHILGKVAAAEHFGEKYNLTMKDLTTLRQAETPDVMEEMAKKISEDRKVRDELAQLRAAQVPPQKFDNSQGEPSVAANDASWLDRYNAGDRSPNAVSAARRATGLG